MTTQAPTAAKLQELVGLINYDLTQLASGRKSSATQARKKLSSLAKECTALRSACLEYQRGLPVKSRKKKSDDEPELQDIEDLADDLAPLALERQVAEPPPSPKKSKRGRKKRAS